nr:MAG TPA: terminase small subunit [Caudoviricetes sp.]
MVLIRFILSSFLSTIDIRKNTSAEIRVLCSRYFCIYTYKRGEIVATKKKSNAGRKGLYKEWLEADNLIRLEGWARNGLTDEMIAHNIGITTTTLYDWKKKYPQFAEAIKRGKEVVDIMVENALLKSAMGYSYDEVTQIGIEDGETGEKILVPVKVVTKHVQPNSTSLIFWLKNRKPEAWRDTKNIDAAVEFRNPFEGIDTADIKKLIGDE